MFVAKYSLLGKNSFNPTQLQRQSLLWSGKKVVQSSFKNSRSTTTPNLLLMKITQMTQNCQMNTGKLKGAILFQK